MTFKSRWCDIEVLGRSPDDSIRATMGTLHGLRISMRAGGLRHHSQESFVRQLKLATDSAVSKYQKETQLRAATLPAGGPSLAPGVAKRLRAYTAKTRAMHTTAQSASGLINVTRYGDGRVTFYLRERVTMRLDQHRLTDELNGAIGAAESSHQRVSADVFRDWFPQWDEERRPHE